MLPQLLKQQKKRDNQYTKNINRNNKSNINDKSNSKKKTSTSKKNKQMCTSTPNYLDTLSFINY